MNFRNITAAVATALLAACSTGASLTGPTPTEEDFGNSVDSLIKAQVVNPSTLTNPSTAPVTGVDPDYANNVVEAMREGVSKSESVRQPIQIRVGGDGAN